MILNISSKLCFDLLFIISIVTGNRIYDVVIIGAGPAGIAAAIDLKKASPNITLTVLEARNRVGGRAFTDTYTFNDGVSVDIGAEWIHAYGPNNPLYSIHRQMQTVEDKQGDQFFEFFEPSVTGCFDTNGMNISRSLCRQAQDTFDRLFAPKDSGSLQNRDMSVREMIQEDYKKIPDGPLKRLVDAMIIGKEEYEAADLEAISGRQYFFGDSSADDEEENGDDMALQRGYGSLIQRIAKYYMVPVELNTKVTHILTNDSNLVHMMTNRGTSLQSKVALVTVPLGCLKQHSIVFEPSLPAWKRNAINRMGFGDTDKIILQFDRVFWDAKLTTLYIGGAYFPFAICAPKKRILVFMVGGTRARAMEQTTDDQILAIVLKELKNTFHQQTFKLQRYRISRWTQDPYSVGSYSYYALNTSSNTYDVLGQQCCQNRLFWAGEHTSPGGSVHTAYATGQREAKKILFRLK